ncbi:MAG: alpha-2-macroglobulin family protein, partial [Acidobacteriota bacterium]
ASGKHLLKIDFESVKPPRPYTISASASVQDVNRQTWSSSTSLLVHPSDLYVGIKTPRTFVQKGEKIEVDSIVSDIDGNLVAGRDAEIKAVLKDWTFEKGTWVEKVVDEQSCAVKSAATAQQCSFVAKQGGQYTITATVMDDKERFNESDLTVWVPGGKMPPKRNVEQEEVQIIPSKKDFAPGDVAELLVISPFTPAEGVLTLRRDGLVKTERFTMKDSSITLKIPLDEKYLPNIIAQVDLVGAEARTNDKGEVETKLAKRPAFASGNINLAISTASRKLTVTADAADKTLAPGGSTKINVDVKDYRGEPVANTEVALVVVDESVLALSRYTIGDPSDTFYTARGAGVTDYHSRKDVLLGNPEDVKTPPPPPVSAPSRAVFAGAMGGDARKMPMAAMKSQASADMAMNESVTVVAEAPDTPINLRENFNALALFSPTVKTDSSGRAVVELKLPDNLTRYRITAVAVDTGKRFGKYESNITAKQPLMVRPSAPRFMNFGDKIDLPVVIQNQTDKDMAVDVAIRATNAALGVGNPHDSKGVDSDTGAIPKGQAADTNTDGKRVLVKANDRVEVRFPVSAVKAGTARFQFVATSGNFSDAAEISLPVWTPATTEAFATYGTTDQNGAIFQPVQAPGDVFPQFGGLEVTTSSTQLQELTDAYIYLANYPYECSEQIASRMISTAALRDVLTAFKSKDMPSAAELDKRFARDLEILQSRQRDDGSFGLWKRDRERYEYPFLTVHVAHALILAKAKGYKVPDAMIAKVKPYLKDVEKHYDQWYVHSPEVRWTISAYALYVRDMMGDKDVVKTKKLLAEATIEKMPFEALGWVLSVLANDPGSQTEVQAILHFLNNRVTETAAAANFVTNYGDGAWLIMYSNRRADGVLLEAMIKADPKNDLIPKLVRGLLDHRTKGAWSNTQENVFILLALDKYFNAFEKVTPDFITRIWLGNTYAAEETFKGRSVDSQDLNIPMSYLMQQGGMSNLILDKQGAGRLYYRIGMKYAPKNLKLEPADYGFTVLRKYEAVDDKADVTHNADGTWTIKAGARVRVRLTMVAQSRRYHVALVDYLPAGLEILNPELATTEAIPADSQPNTSVLEVGSSSYGYNSWWWRQNWFEHQNFRDERAEAFTSLLWEGVYNYSFVTRATTPGQFVVPPAKAEEMYHPETFGRSGTDFVRVE